MSTIENRYPARVARMLVDKAIVYGIPLTKVEAMYRMAKQSARQKVPDIDRNRPAYFNILRHIFEAGIRKYSAKCNQLDKMEVREILTRNRDKLIAGLTRIDNGPKEGNKGTGAEVQPSLL